MKNTDKAYYWLKMAEEDYKDAKISIENKRFPSAVFHAQQCCEKVCKAILVYFGIEPGKNFPSHQIELRIIRGNKYSLEKEKLEILERIVSLSHILESQKEFPRYGWETVDRIIMPSEIYDATKSTLLFKNGAEVLRLAKNLLGI
ncbi:MAG: HEPN domain-containing protein [Candidatus Hydrothermarchaeota archaeon]